MLFRSFDSDDLFLLPVRRGLPLEADRSGLGVAIMTIMATAAQAVDVFLRPFLRSKRPGLASFGICCVFGFVHNLKCLSLLNLGIAPPDVILRISDSTYLCKWLLVISFDMRIISGLVGIVKSVS